MLSSLNQARRRRSDQTLRAFVTNSAFDLTSYDYLFDTTGFSKTNMEWTLEHFSFTNMTAGNVQLQLVSTNDNTAFGAAIAGINVSPVPEPATWAMLLLGYGGIGMMMHRRHTAALNVCGPFVHEWVPRRRIQILLARDGCHFAWP